ncbi:hypothetical protein HD554DRAFT_2038460 [Boletus coccyginus]|nr:hypothetical protein HD554DRAFT_2038460 [Boletus coccyginus]
MMPLMDPVSCTAVLDRPGIGALQGWESLVEEGLTRMPRESPGVLCKEITVNTRCQHQRQAHLSFCMFVTALAADMNQVISVYPAVIVNGDNIPTLHHRSAKWWHQGGADLSLGNVPFDHELGVSDEITDLRRYALWVISLGVAIISNSTIPSSGYGYRIRPGLMGINDCRPPQGIRRPAVWASAPLDRQYSTPKPSLVTLSTGQTSQHWTHQRFN